MKRTEMTVNGLATYHEPTFRTYAPEWVSGPNGTLILTQHCEERIGGRWEGFITIKSARDAHGQKISLKQAYNW